MEPTAPPAPDGKHPPLPITGAEYRATAILLALFIVTMAIALLLARPSSDAGLQAFEEEDDPMNVGVYIVLILAFTFLILAIAKWGKKWIIKAIILAAVGSALLFVFLPLLLRAGVGWDTAGLASLLLAALGTFALYKHPEWYVIDTVGVLVAAGAAAIFGISLVPWLVVVLLAALAVYDAIAVYKTKHMLALADSVIELRLPVLLVIPKVARYSFRREAGHFKEASQANKAEREAMFMGLGDLVMPTILVVSALIFLPGLGVQQDLRADILVAPGDVSEGDLHPTLRGDVVSEGRQATVRYTFTVPGATPPVRWTLDVDEDEDPDLDGEGLNPVTYHYDRAGDYRIVLHVTDADGRTGTAETVVDVHRAPGPWYESLTDTAANPAALGAAIGTLLGYLVLMSFVLRGNPQAGLPLLNGGSIAGFLVGLYAATGSLVFW